MTRFFPALVSYSMYEARVVISVGTRLRRLKRLGAPCSAPRLLPQVDAVSVGRRPFCGRLLRDVAVGSRQPSMSDDENACALVGRAAVSRLKRDR